MYERFVADPGAVSDSWQEFFADYHSQAPSVAAAAAASPQVKANAEVHGVAAETLPAPRASGGANSCASSGSNKWRAGKCRAC